MLNVISGIDSTASALTAERIRMEVVSQNIANVNTSRGPGGKPYQRQHVVFETLFKKHLNASGDSRMDSPTVRIASIEPDGRPPRLVHNPFHPDANEQGMVPMPDINVHEEMIDLIASSRAFEANLSVVKNARNMAMQTLAIGKRS